ncbi:hypothetical protein RUND412_011349, partial [Rhizina undulata]
EYANTTAPAELALRLVTLADVFNITGVYWGARADFDTVRAPLLAKWPSTYSVTYEELGWLDMLSYLADGAALPQPEVYVAHDTFFAKSLVATAPLTNNTLTNFFTYLDNGRNASVKWWVLADLYGGTHSVINSVPAASTSYSVRDSLFTFQLYSETTDALPPYPASGIEFMNEMVKSITTAQPETKFKAYPNYVDSTFSASEAHDLYYGDNYARLLSIKESVDPDLLLWNPQAIGA